MRRGTRGSIWRCRDRTVGRQPEKCVNQPGRQMCKSTWQMCKSTGEMCPSIWQMCKSTGEMCKLTRSKSHLAQHQEYFLNFFLPVSLHPSCDVVWALGSGRCVASCSWPYDTCGNCLVNIDNWWNWIVNKLWTIGTNCEIVNWTDTHSQRMPNTWLSFYHILSDKNFKCQCLMLILVTIHMLHVINQMLILIPRTCWTTFVIMSMLQSDR